MYDLWSLFGLRESSFFKDTRAPGSPFPTGLFVGRPAESDRIFRDIANSSSGRRTPVRGIASVLVALSLLLIPNHASAQSPSPEEALDVAVEHLRDRSEVFDDWHLGVDPAWAGWVRSDVVIDAAGHRELLTRIAEAGELPFYPGEDFGRVVCAASPDPELPPENCRFSHGTRSMLKLIVVSTEERGVTQVLAFSRRLLPVATLHRGELRVGSPSRVLILNVEYDRDGLARVNTEETVTARSSGAVAIDEIRGSPPGT